jgi:hypothetical protein
MKRYKTIDTVQLFSGLIGLDARQAKPRLNVGQIVPAGIGIYEIITQVQFKAGEIILLDDPKGPARSLECLDIDLPPSDPTPASESTPDSQTSEPPAVESKRSPGRPAIARGGRK